MNKIKEEEEKKEYEEKLLLLLVFFFFFFFIFYFYSSSSNFLVFHFADLIHYMEACMDGVLVSLFFFSFVSMKNVELVIWMHGTMCWMNIVMLL